MAIPNVWLLSADIMSQLGGGFRQQRWCEYILREGHPIRLFAVEGAFRVRFADVSTVEELRARREEWIASTPPRAGVRDSRLARYARLIKHVFLIDLLLPSLVRLLMLLHSMMSQAPERVVLLCSSPPFGMGLVGRVFKILHRDRVALVLDMRDLWSLHSAFPGPKAHKRAVERWVIAGSDIFTTVAPSLARRFERQFGRRPEVVYNIATQVSLSDLPGGAPDWPILSPLLRADTLKVVYTGSIPASFYDLEGFLSALKAFAMSSQGLPIQFLFVGAAGELASRAERHDLPEGLLVFITQVPHAMVASIQCSADALLFLGYLADDNQGQVSIKLFEYFRREKPILPIHIRAGSDVDDLIARYCGKRLNLIEGPEIVGALRDLADRKFDRLPRASNSQSIDAHFLEAYTTETAKILRLLDKRNA